MRLLTLAKRAAINCGLYKPARILHRALLPSERARYAAFRALYGQFIRDGDLAFDVGANIGIRTDVMLGLGAFVVAFEPQPALTPELRARDNGKLVVVAAAVGATEGAADLQLSSLTSTLASLVPNWSNTECDSIRVPVTTLDAAIRQYGRPTFAKIDVEGYEPEVLKGLSVAIKAMSIEYLASRIDNVHECFDLIGRLGDYTVNLTGGDEARLLLPEFLPAATFREVFPACANSHTHGDIFVTLQQEKC